MSLCQAMPAMRNICTPAPAAMRRPCAAVDAILKEGMRPRHGARRCVAALRLPQAGDTARDYDIQSNDNVATPDVRCPLEN